MISVAVVRIGTRLGPYEIVARVGAGGMGEVWKARDTRLHRDVAVKVLPDETAADRGALVRFEREARAVAALSHPNILAIHDFANEGAVAYAVMELLEGATLRERLGESRLALARALDWSHQIAQGLAAAHERGIIHRDLKPENIFITRDGVVKILDFGLARVLNEDPGSLSDEVPTLAAKTTPGAVVGTIGYLSPEQARSETADHRSDIFALGAVLFEMLTGHPAFLRPSVAETMAAILREEPKPLADFGLAVPSDVEDILRHCLEKNRDERFRSARDLAFALRLAARAAAGPATEHRSPIPRRSDSGSRPSELSIAVLPFRNMSASADTEYFSDGMTEEIINSISNIPALNVASRTSSFAFKGRADDIRKIGRELGVVMVLEGSVRQIGSRLRVSAQLVNVDTGYQVWSDRWDRELADVFAVQDEIAQAIAATFKLRWASDEGSGTEKTQNIEAYDHYLKGRYLLTARRAREAIAEFQQAVDHDPDFADAHTALADGWAIHGFYGGVPSWEAWARGRAAVEEAERIAPDAAGIPLSRAILEHYYGWNTAREEELLRSAIEKNPKSADGWNWLGLLYAITGRTSESLETIRHGIGLEPYDVNLRASAGWAHIWIGDFETAERTLAKALEINPEAVFVRWTYGTALRFLGRVSEAISVFDRLVEGSNRRVPLFLALLGGALGASGDRAKAEEILALLDAQRREGRYVPSLDRATVLIGLGDAEGAIDALEQARHERNALLWARLYFPEFASLRDDSRWKNLAQRLGRSAPMAQPMRGA